MAEALYLVTRSASVALRTVNGVQAVLINKDSGQTNDQIIADAIVQCNKAYNSGADATDQFAADYFDTVTAISTSGELNDDKDAFIFADTAPLKVEG